MQQSQLVYSIQNTRVTITCIISLFWRVHWYLGLLPLAHSEPTINMGSISNDSLRAWCGQLARFKQISRQCCWWSVDHLWLVELHEMVGHHTTHACQCGMVNTIHILYIAQGSSMQEPIRDGMQLTKPWVEHFSLDNTWCPLPCSK